MNEIINHNIHFPIINVKQSLQNKSNISFLQDRLDESEKIKEKPFSTFNDIEMIQWYLYRKEHINEQHEKSERTIEEYRRELQLFIEQLLTYSNEIHLDIDSIQENSLFKSMSPRHIRRYQEWLVKKSPYVKKYGSYSAATIARKTTILKNFFSFLYEVKYIQEPLHKGFYKAKVKSDDRPNRDLSPTEVIQLLDYFREKQHPIAFAIIHILTTTGLRNEEFCKLKVKHVQYDTILGGYFLDVLGKGNKKRQIPLREKTFNSIAMFRFARGLQKLKDASPEDPLFTTNTYKPYTPSYLSQYLTQQIKKTELPFSEKRSSQIGPHTFRHAFAIISYKSGSDLYKIMKSLGHQRIETTMIYLQKIMEREEHAIHEWNKDVFGEYI